MPTLTHYNDYSRSEVHDIFAPDSVFTPQAGTWGLQGIIPIPDREGDFVFFVTFGQKQGAHVFDERITTDGVITWQSQPKQKLSDRLIQELIRHNEDVNSIYLFLRTSTGRKYTYLGRLKYLAHDRDREQPVYFQWQILGWGIPDLKAKEINLQLEASSSPISIGSKGQTPALVKTDPPTLSHNKTGNPLPTTIFRMKKNTDYAGKNLRDKRIGTAGELLAVEYERKELLNAGFPELADRVRHVADLEGDGAGYDIESFTSGGIKKFIEVKTTTGDKENEFFITANELEFSKQHSESFYLYRIYNYDEKSRSGEFFCIQGPLETKFCLVPVQFRVKLV